MKGATPSGSRNRRRSLVSIHAPNEGSDVSVGNQNDGKWFVSIHAPNEGSDVSPPSLRGVTLFQSTLPMKGATSTLWLDIHLEDVSIHAPNEGSDSSQPKRKSGSDVSIHAPNEGSDPTREVFTAQFFLFQSTLPMKGATQGDGERGNCNGSFNPRSQ